MGGWELALDTPGLARECVYVPLSIQRKVLRSKFIKDAHFIQFLMMWGRKLWMKGNSPFLPGNKFGGLD
jgi:hypothetical protein